MNLAHLKQRLSKNIKERRSELGISQEKLAHLSGIDRTYMSEIERELANPTIEILVKIASALETTPVDLLAD